MSKNDTNKLLHTVSSIQDDYSMNKNDTVALKKESTTNNLRQDDILKAEIQQEIIDIVATIGRIKDKSTISNSTNLSSLGLDSLDQTEVMLVIEDKFRHSIPDEAASKLRTIQDIVEYILPYKKSMEK
ncbi:phosphopantetheine attachment site family protein [Orientia chuto str. Dubai]|uniref:Phosphopantetheine attachment site family protein n=1 Tax=Orientia chuto str. Dubai TaxID=1359168 RepID=A0A0F3MI42_9RICK|nr:acyl carrier protein [Candidatus Orientia mediorientalis]KJV55438.1 phosphopantetheine attachment site family protein [Orientia chuto str. Dubai]